MKYIFILLITLVSFSCSEILNETDISNETISTIAPTEAAELSGTTVSFNWEEMEGATEYHLQIVQPNFTTATQLILDSLVNGTGFTKQLDPSQYEWRVRGQNSAYETVYTTSTFTVLENDDFESNTLLLESPVDNFISNEAIHNLSWQEVTGALEYRLQVWQPNTDGTLLSDINIADTNTDFTFLDGDFLWQVKAVNATQSTAYTARNITVDATAPNTPTLLLPENASTHTAGSISYTWEREIIVGSAEVDSLYVYNDEALTNLIFKEEVSDNNYSTNMIADTYFWRMKSFDELANESEYTGVFTFIVE